MEWSSDHSVGNVTLDAQHEALFGICRRLRDRASLPAIGAGQVGIEDLLLELDGHSAEHFADEEALLERFRYPQIKAHKAEHARYLQTVGEFLARARDGVPVADEVLRWTEHWISHHMRGADMDYARYFEQLGRTSQPPQ